MEDSRSYSITKNALAEVSTFVSQLLPTIISTCGDDTIGLGQSSECHHRKRRKCGVSSTTAIATTASAAESVEDVEMTNKDQVVRSSVAYVSHAVAYVFVCMWMIFSH